MFIAASKAPAAMLHATPKLADRKLLDELLKCKGFP
jgi:hypothetical protein